MSVRRCSPPTMNTGRPDKRSASGDPRSGRNGAGFGAMRLLRPARCFYGHAANPLRDDTIGITRAACSHTRNDPRRQDQQRVGTHGDDSPRADRLTSADHRISVHVAVARCPPQGCSRAATARRNAHVAAPAGWTTVPERRFWATARTPESVRSRPALAANSGPDRPGVLLA